MPTLDEERYIRRCLTSLLSQINPSSGEVLVVDGGSTDSTLDIVSEMGSAHPHLRWVSNPRRLQASAVNLAASLASPKSQILLRADAHARYPGDFVKKCMEALVRTRTWSTVVPLRAVGETCFQRAAAAAQNARIGNGGAAHRKRGGSGFVDHGHHAAFDLSAFRRVGGYDESFSHNEDAEFDHRLLAAGGRIFMCGDAAVEYFPRSRPTQLARQYYNHGRGRARTLLKHRMRPKVRQMLPPVIVVGSVGGLIGAYFAPIALALPVSYALACNAAAIGHAIRMRDRCLLALGFAAMVMHFGWGAGFIRGLVSGLGGNPVAGSGVELGTHAYSDQRTVRE